MTVQIDGIAIGNLNTGVNSGSAWSNFSLNDAAAQEMVFETGAISTEASSGGVRVNVIPREGGNRFSGSGFGNFSKRSMERNNLTADLQARNPVLRSPGFDSLVDESAAFGGPIRRDRLWFFVAHRYRSNDLTGSNQFYSINPLAYVQPGLHAAPECRRLGHGQPGAGDGAGVGAQQSVRLLRQNQQVQLSDD